MDLFVVSDKYCFYIVQSIDISRSILIPHGKAGGGERVAGQGRFGQNRNGKKIVFNR